MVWGGTLQGQVRITKFNQKAHTHYERSIQFFDQGNLMLANQEVKKALALDSNYTEAWLIQATIFEDLKMIDSAVYAYREAAAINADVFPMGLFKMAKLESSIGLYQDADLHFTRYLQHPKASEKYTREAIYLQQKNKVAMELSKDVVPFNPIGMGDSINTPEDEYLPSLTADDQTLIFTKRFVKDYQARELSMEEDFYISTRDSLGQWAKAVRMPEPINSNSNEGAQCLSADGRFLYFTACNRPDGKGSCDIYVSQKKGDLWEVPTPLGYPINTKGWESQPSIAADGRTLYFVSNREGGKGGTDIWVSVLSEEGYWSYPKNLGDSINTPLMENAPFIHPDGKTLYFSSNGHEGLGGLDIYYSKKKADGTWAKAVNIGYPINTHSNDISLIVNAKGDKAYFSSDRPGGKGKQDIYYFDLYEKARPTMVSFMKGKVVDQSNEQPLDATFEVIDLKTKDVVVSSVSDPINGEFLVSLPVGREYVLNVSKKDYLFYSDHIFIKDTHQLNPLFTKILLQPIRKGQEIVLKNIFFQTDSYELNPLSEVELRKLYMLLKEQPLLCIEIGGHTDNSGAEMYNLTLSEKRAESVKKYLEDKGIEPSRLKAVGYGFRKPIDTNDTPEGKANNRRTEIKVL